jgi:hypothetical protein
MPTSGRRKRLTPWEERYIRITAGRDRFLPATRIFDRVRRATGVRISAQAVRNKPKACRFKSRRPHKGMELAVHHKTQRHAWTNQQLYRNWKTVLFSDESQFTQMVAFVSGEGLVNDLRRLVLCHLTALVAVNYCCGEECITPERPTWWW